MSRRSLEVASFPLLFLVSVAAWAAWLGWDQHRDVQPDGSETGPYGAWQVIGLVLTLSVPLYWAASRRHGAAAVLATSAGLAASAWYDWSDDSSGLYVIGVGMVLAGSLVATTVFCALIASATGRGHRGRPAQRGRA
ncbi:hypothetical protein AB0F18_24185 [Streptomyces sp. NPDC029216]|uniref:hypothetical protein n=1 Tax=Streptomyces sp. NPDC029216 TaxID=3154701 RepID=UPI00340F427A